VTFATALHCARGWGRNEVDNTQEINALPILRGMVARGYTGYVGQESIPTRDPIQSLREGCVFVTSESSGETRPP